MEKIIEEYRPLYEACKKKNYNARIEKAKDFLQEGFAENGFAEVFAISPEIREIVDQIRKK